jgi:hypothetical protein
MRVYSMREPTHRQIEPNYYERIKEKEWGECFQVCRRFMHEAVEQEVYLQWRL